MQNSLSGVLLIVDDEPSVRRSLERVMRTEGYEIRSAEDASAAERVLAESSVDVILCDQDMPGKNGTDFLTEAAARYPHQRRIMLSGRFRSDDVAAAMDSGAIHKFMMKPWDDQILKADIRESFRQLMADLKQEEQLGQLSNTPKAAHTETSGNAESWQAFEENRGLIRELHEAANNGSLSLQYQPQIDLRTDEVCGLEALLRWESTLGPVRPDRFIALAERSGSISKLTHWVINEVCHRLLAWRPSWSNARVALNVSPVDLRNGALTSHLSAAMAATGVPASALQVEVTETELLSVDGNSLSVLEAMAELGISLAIDDFGAGATSVSYLTKMPFTSVKIDRALTQQVDTERGLTVVQRLLELCQALNMKTTVEGVETQAQLEVMRRIGVDVVQGYYFSPPRKIANICDWIEAGARGIPE